MLIKFSILLQSSPNKRVSHSLWTVQAINSVLMRAKYRVSLSWVEALRENDISEPLVNIFCVLQHSVNQLQLRSVCAMDRHSCQGKERTEVVRQTRQVVCGARMRHKAERALIEGHLRIDGHEWVPTGCKQSGA